MKDNLIKIALVAVLLATSQQPGHAQGTFLNLNFEHPILPLIPDATGLVPITRAMPGWTGYTYGATPDDRVVYNDVCIGSACIDFLGTGSGYQPFEGSYFVALQPQYDLAVLPAIAQLGTVPTTAESVRFYAYGSLVVSFAGQQIPLSSLGSTSEYTIYGGDISKFAGQTGWLQFQGNAFLDNIFFSAQQVPEPGVFGLLALGALLIRLRVLRRR